MTKILVQYKHGMWRNGVGEEVVEGKYYATREGRLNVYTTLVLTPDRSISLDIISNWEVIPEETPDESKEALRKRLFENHEGGVGLDSVAETFLRVRGTLTSYYIASRYQLHGTAFYNSMNMADQYRLKLAGRQENLVLEQETDGPQVLDNVRFLLDTDVDFPASHPIWNIPGARR